MRVAVMTCAEELDWLRAWLNEQTGVEAPSL